MSQESKRTDLVTGAFSYTGRYLAGRLLASGINVRTLTGHPARPEAAKSQIDTRPYEFDDPAALAASFENVHTFYNTYWVRFDRGDQTHERAVDNTRRLFRAAEEAGVQRIVHVSIANPSPDSPLPYYRGKAALEQTLAASGVSHAIVRPTVVFGDGGILVNNIAWLLRHLPLFAVIGAGNYRIQPVYVDDLAELMIGLGNQTENTTVEAVGPEVYTFLELVTLIRSEVGSRAAIVHVPAHIGYVFGRVLGLLLGDVLLTREEIAGLTANLLVSTATASCKTSFRAWLQGNRRQLGARYLSELSLHYD